MIKSSQVFKTYWGDFYWVTRPYGGLSDYPVEVEVTYAIEMLMQLKSTQSSPHLSALFFIPTLHWLLPGRYNRTHNSLSLSPSYHFICKKLLQNAAVVGTDGTNGIWKTKFVLYLYISQLGRYVVLGAKILHQLFFQFGEFFSVM